MVIKKFQFFVIYVNYGFTLNAVTSIMLIIEYSSGWNDLWYCLNCNWELCAPCNLNKQNFVSFIREDFTDSPEKVTQTGKYE